MFFLSDINNIHFKRGKDKKKRKNKLGSLSLPASLAGSAIGSGIGLAGSGLLAIKTGKVKYLLPSTLGGALTGGSIGYGVGQKMNKKMKFGKYQK